MKYALVLSGALAGLAVATPDLVLLGYIFLIIPGLVLTVAPTLFAYLATIAIIKRLLPIGSPIGNTAVACAMALFIGWALMQPFRISAIAAFHEAELADVLPSQALQLHGHVRLERTHQRVDPECDYLCLAVLDSPGVQSVTTVTAGRGKPQSTPPSNAYSLVSATTDSAVSDFPSEPGEIVRKYQPLIKKIPGLDFNTAIKSVEASWAMRLAGSERLRAAKPVAPESADWIIRIENPSNRRTSTLRRITILDAHGTTHFRQTYRKQSVPAGMFYLGYHANLSGGTASAYFHVGHQLLEEGTSSLDPESALLQTIKFTVPSCSAESINLLRDHVVQALDNPTSTTTQLDLARTYLGLFFFDAKEHDEMLIARIVADDRITDIDEQIKDVFSKSKTPTTMRDSFVNRICMRHSSANLRHYLAERLANMPPGTFAEPSQNYHAIWSSPEISQQAAPMIATLADLGSDRAMPILESLLNHAVGLPHWQERRSIIEGIRAALVRLGPMASPMVPQIRDLFLRRPSPIMNNYGDANQWRFALARMGVAIEDLPVLPTQTPQSAEKERQRVAEQLRRYAEIEQ